MKQSWFYKVYSFFRWDLWHFFGNIWRFRKELWNHNWWDYHFTLEMLYRSISIMEKGMHDGLEIPETRYKKIQKMQRLLELLDNQINDRYIELAEKELGYEMIMKGFEFKEVDKTDSNGEPLYELIGNETEEEAELNRKIFDKCREIEETQWKEIWEILKGQEHTEYINMVQHKSTEVSQKDWNDWFDGTGLRGWWD